MKNEKHTPIDLDVVVGFDSDGNSIMAERLSTWAYNRIDSHAGLTAALDGCINALTDLMRRHIYPDCGCAVCDTARAALEAAKKARQS